MTIASGVHPLGSRLRVLFVDDDADTCDVYSFAAEALGIEGYVAREGPAAIPLAAIVCPHVVVLDVRMPYVDGFETLRRMRERRSTRDIPVIMASASPPQTWGSAVARCGCARFLQKPFDLDLLERTLRAVVPSFTWPSAHAHRSAS